MVCIDTSIFITIHRQPKSPLAIRMFELASDGEAALCGQVWVELIGGFRNVARRKLVRKGLVEYAWIETSRDAFDLAANWVATYRGIGAGDAIIAATAYLNHCPLFTVDRGFKPLCAAGLELL